jgi:hypothetical protein
LTSNTLYLTKVRYLEEKKRIVLEFSNSELKRTKSFLFFPSFFLEKRVPKKELNTILSNYNPQRFRADEKQHAFQVTASSFRDLKCLANLCLGALGQRPLLLEPERQFLLTMGWSYFDAFHFLQGNPVRSNRIHFPDANVSELTDSTQETALQLLGQDRQAGLGFIKALALSKVLRLPFDGLPESEFLELETIMENMLFESGFALAAEGARVFHKRESKKPNCQNAVEMDFSGLWALLLTHSFYNLGFDSLNCECCKPKSLFERNVLPNSRVIARFLREGFYFESALPAYAGEFHRQNPLAHNRLRLQREFCLNYLPVGPFKRNQTAELLLCDAVKLCSAGSVELVDTAALHWFCLRRESFLSLRLRRLYSSAVSLSKQLAAEEKAAFQKHGLVGNDVLANNLNFLFKDALRQILKRLYCSIPAHLTNPASTLFSRPLSDSIEALQGLTMHRFSELLRERNGRVLAVGSRSALVRTNEPMSLLKEFSKREKLPLLVSQVKRPLMGGAWAKRLV